ncbi:MAG: aminoacyl-histidine dipeptidase [Candidatus Lokiarchaeota archaeon]|nr:aminoacyl-histidine dipeptidase [Candidatus Lokiarchaeota archaeon]
MEDLKDFGEPLEFWQYFYEITKIPRCSQQEEKIRDYILNEAKKMGYQVDMDEIQNLVIRVPYKMDSKLDNLKVVLQSHMDMVCEKHERSQHDFAKDPLKLKLIEIKNEKWLTAEDTTLGADNGVGIAYQLTIMKKIHDGTLDIGALDLDLLFTVDEERGLSGASLMDKNLVSGNYLLNLDSEEDNKFTIGCAGGRVFRGEIKYKRELLSNPDLIAVKISISGLLGGHSGSDINKKRGNALKVLSEVLWKVNSKFDIVINSLDGGNLTNAIPREANVIIYINKEQKKEIEAFLKELTSNIKNLYKGSDSNFEISINPIEEFTDKTSFSRNFQQKMIDLFYIMPNGPISLHPTSDYLVHTSLNFAVVHTFENVIEFKISTRSLTQYDKDTLFEKLKTLFKMSGLDIDIEVETIYPSWPPDFNSKLTEISKQVYSSLFDKEVVIQAIHAGLECAYFSYYYPDMEMISLGPNVRGGHSPDERLQIRSVSKIWNFLISLLKNLAQLNE